MAAIAGPSVCQSSPRFVIASALHAIVFASLLLSASEAAAQMLAALPDTSSESSAGAVATKILPFGPEGAEAASTSRPPAASDKLAQAKPDGHPLLPVLHWAQEGLPAIEKLQDYSATLVKRERVNGRLSDFEYLAIKIRHKPFSVYVDFLAPAKVQGQEVLYVEGQNRGHMWAHRAHLKGTVSIHPESLVAMNGRRYPLTEIGLVNLVRRLVEVGQQDIHFGECEVQYLRGAKLNKRPCTVIQVVHPQSRPEFRFHLARVFVDDELKLPTRYESYAWPQEPDGSPELLEEYTYLDLKLNNGFSDQDFSTENPGYRFR